MLKLLLISFLSVFAFASGGGEEVRFPDLTMTWVGFLSLIIFIVGYYFSFKLRFTNS